MKYDLYYDKHPNRNHNVCDSFTDIKALLEKNKNNLNITDKDVYLSMLLYEYKGITPGTLLTFSEDAQSHGYENASKHYAELSNILGEYPNNQITQLDQDRRNLYSRVYEELDSWQNSVSHQQGLLNAKAFLTKSCKQYLQHFSKTDLTPLAEKKREAVQNLVAALDEKHEPKDPEKNIKEFISVLKENKSLIDQSRSSFLYRMGVFCMLFFPALAVGLVQGYFNAMDQAHFPGKKELLAGENVMTKLFRHSFFSEGAEFTNDVEEMVDKIIPKKDM